MTLSDQTHAAKLIELAHERFDADLRDAEVRVLRDSSSSVVPFIAHPDLPLLEVRAEFLRWLAIDPEARKHIDPQGLRVYAAKVTGGLDLRECRGMPTLEFRRCEFSERINLNSAGTSGLFFFDCVVGKEFSADRLVVQGALLLRRSQFSGEVRLGGAVIKDSLECDGAKLTAPEVALFLERASVGGSVFLRNGFESTGEIRLPGARIGGDFDCSGAKLTAPGYGLFLDAASFGGDVFIGDGFECSGAIRLLGAEIEGDLFFLGAQVAQVRCRNLRLSGDLIWQGIEKLPNTDLNLAGAAVKNLRDDRASWPAEGMLSLDGLVYQDLTLHEPPKKEHVEEKDYGKELLLIAEERVGWLMRQSKEARLEPQPWMQLAKHLEAKGDKAGAKHVLFRFRRLQAAESSLLWQWVRIAFAWLEEAPVRILWSIAFTLTAGTLIFAGASRSGAMIPTARSGNGGILSGEALAHYVHFEPFVYTLENSLPLVRLGMDDKWAPDPNHGGDAWFPGIPWLAAFNSYRFLTGTRWFLILFGWFQAAVLGAALTSRFKP